MKEWRELKVQSRPADISTKAQIAGAPSLKEFSSMRLVEALHQTAEEAKLPLDEISYALEEGGNQPFLRYRATLTVSANYTAIRRFIDQVSGKMGNVALDGITCSREDIGVKDLSCDVALSAFYRKGDRG